jgi:hypothetical protein
MTYRPFLPEVVAGSVEALRGREPEAYVHHSLGTAS